MKSILPFLAAASVTFVSLSASAANLPSGFTEAHIGSNLSGSPTAMAFAPDGRLFVCLQGGQVRVIRGSRRTITPTSITPSDFATHNRVSRFTTAGAGDSVILYIGV